MNGWIVDDVAGRIRSDGEKRHECYVIKKKSIVWDVKGKFYKTVVRPGATYGSECWTLNKEEEIKSKVAEMKLLNFDTHMDRDK